MQLDENIAQIIIRHLNHETSEQEKTELETWLQTSPANQQEFETYIKIWEDSSRIIIEHNFDTSVAWQKLQKKIQLSQGSEPMKVVPLFSLKRVAAAAAIIILVTTATIYLLNSNKEISRQNISALQNNRQISLPDGSTVTLRKGSALSYPDNFGDQERSLELSGEAYFEVQHNEQKPFRVTTSDAVIEVLGTSFLVRNTDLVDQVVVSTGKVRFAERKNISHQVILTKGQKAELIKKQFTKDTVLNRNYLAWQNGKLIFYDTSLKQVAEDVSHFYQVEIMFSPEVEKRAGSITIKAEFERQTLEQVLDEIQLITGLRVNQENGIVVIGY